MKSKVRRGLWNLLLFGIFNFYALVWLGDGLPYISPELLAILRSLVIPVTVLAVVLVALRARAALRPEGE